MTQEIEKIWPEWKAIKVISIPKDASEMESLRSDGMTQDGTRTYLQGIVDDFVNEIQLMETLKGIQNIVSVEDYKVVERTGEIGWDIYIRMELLTPLNVHLQRTVQMPRGEVVRMGIHLCRALELCQRHNIIHRDVKSENIFEKITNDYAACEDRVRSFDAAFCQIYLTVMLFFDISAFAELCGHCGSACFAHADYFCNVGGFHLAAVLTELIYCEEIFFLGICKSVHFFFSPWQLPPLQAQPLGQQEHFPPQNDLPFFLSLYICLAARNTIPATIRPTIKVDILPRPFLSL